MTSCTAGVSEGLGANPDLLCFFTFEFQNDKPLLGRGRKKKKKHLHIQENSRIHSLVLGTTANEPVFSHLNQGSMPC